MDHSRVVEVMIGEYGMYKFDRQTDGILTEGLASCIALVLFHRETKTGLVAHFWPFKDVKDSFKKIESDLKRLGIDPNQLEGSVQNGAYPTLESTAARIVAHTRKMGVKKLRVSIFGTSSFQGNNPMNVVLELHSGALKGYSVSTPTIKPDVANRLDRYLNNREGALDVAPNSL